MIGAKARARRETAVNIPANPRALIENDASGRTILEMMARQVDEAGGWMFAPEDVKNILMASREVDGQRIVTFDVGERGLPTVTELPTPRTADPVA